MPRITAEEKRRTREKLLKTAADHFAEHGLEGANVDQISVAAGFAKGTLYNYFASKEELFASVVEQGAELAARRAGDLPTGSSARERLLHLARADVEVLREQEAFTKVLVREALGFRAETYPLLLQHLSPYISRVQQVIDDGVACGELRGEVPSLQLAMLFTGLLSLSYVQHWGSGGVWPVLDDVPDFVVTAFLDGAAVRPVREAARGMR